MSILGTFSEAAKLLKVPRIYNALITTDEKLQPSQAFPALSPVIHSIPYPVPTAYIAYQPLIQIPFNSAPGGRSFSYAVKQDFYSYNYFENDLSLADEIRKIPETKVSYDPSALFTPPAVQNVQKQVPFFTSDVKTNLRKLPYSKITTERIDEFQDDFKNIYPPILSLQTPNETFNYSSILQSDEIIKHADIVENKNSKISDSYSTSDFDSESSDKEDSISPDFNKNFQKDYLPVMNTVKNNKPKDPNIVDVPPPPLPIGKQNVSKKDSEEYPPPPLGYIL